MHHVEGPSVRRAFIKNIDIDNRHRHRQSLWPNSCNHAIIPLSKQCRRTRRWPYEPCLLGWVVKPWKIIKNCNAIKGKRKSDLPLRNFVYQEAIYFFDTHRKNRIENQYSCNFWVILTSRRFYYNLIQKWSFISPRDQLIVTVEKLKELQNVGNRDFLAQFVYKLCAYEPNLRFCIFSPPLHAQHAANLFL